MSFSRKLRLGFVGSLFCGGCLLSFFAGRWSSERRNALSPTVMEVAVDIQSATTRETAGRPIQLDERSRPEATQSIAERLFNESGRSFPLLLERQRLYLEELAKQDPQRALRLGGSAASQKERKLLMLAVYRGWGELDLSEALESIGTLDIEDRGDALYAALDGAAASPTESIALWSDLEKSQQFSTFVLRGARGAFVKALADRGYFKEALEFGMQQASLSERVQLMGQTFAVWGRFEPELAVVSAMELENARDRKDAFNTVTTTWAETDPAGLAEFGDALPPGEMREFTLDRALQQWVATEPLAAAEWLENKHPAPEFDSGALALATHPYFAERNPRSALSWAESLYDPGLRADTVSLVVKQWAATDRQAAIEYVKSNSELALPERQELLALFGEKKSFGIDGPLR